MLYYEDKSETKPITKLQLPTLQPTPHQLPQTTPLKDATFTRITTVTCKYHPHRRLVKRTRKYTNERTPKHKTLAVDIEIQL